MLREALKEPRNQRFLMLSDSGVPLYPPTVVWQQLMSESKSRIDACNRVSRSNICTKPSGAGSSPQGRLLCRLAQRLLFACIGAAVVGVEQRPEDGEQPDRWTLPHLLSGVRTSALPCASKDTVSQGPDATKAKVRAFIPSVRASEGRVSLTPRARRAEDPLSCQ